MYEPPRFLTCSQAVKQLLEVADKRLGDDKETGKNIVEYFQEMRVELVGIF